jgi:hypothetical protein
MAWGVLPADVLATTGASATAGQVAAADGVITIYVNRQSTASASMTPRDLATIRAAICWQVPWQAAQPDFLTRNQFDELSQDGLSVSTSAQWAKMLAPLAARALKNLSWKGSKTLRTPNVDADLRRNADFTTEYSDWNTNWYPL